MDKSQASRRDFLKVGALASAGAIGFPYIVSSSALGKAGTTAPSNRIVMGCIGVGGQGTHNMNVFLGNPAVQVVAVCDVEKKSNLYLGGATNGLEPAKAIVDKHYAEKAGGEYKGCDTYKDFRELLARKDIDAVTVCTPDHWHGLISIAAANAGKDIYCEKPLTNSVGEGRAVCEAVYKNRRILQTGSQERSGPRARYACELVRNGRIGRLHTIRINLPFDEPHHKTVLEMAGQPQPEMPVPESLDYDFWLGHTPKVPYSKNRVHFWWRFQLTYGGGEMTDRGAHIIDLAQLGNGTDNTGPVEIKAEGKRAEKAMFNVFTDYRFENVYANGVRMLCENKGPRGLKFEGDDGWIFIHIHGAKLEASNESLLKEQIDEHELHLGRTAEHHQNFLDCVKSRHLPTATAEIGHRTASICHLNNIAMVLGRPLKWDPKAEQFVGDAEANALLTPKMRAPWSLVTA
jgi:predicted dehydrogenase